MSTWRLRVSPGRMVRSKYDPGWPTGSRASLILGSTANAAVGATIAPNASPSNNAAPRRRCLRGEFDANYGAEVIVVVSVPV